MPYPSLQSRLRVSRRQARFEPAHVRPKCLAKRRFRYDVRMPARQRRLPQESLDSVLDFMRLLWSIEHGLQSTSKRMGASLGITGPQRLLLKIVSEFPGMSASEVAHVVRLHPSTITGVIQRLVDKRLLIRERDPADTRRVRLYV